MVEGLEGVRSVGGSFDHSEVRARAEAIKQACMIGSFRKRGNRIKILYEFFTKLPRLRGKVRSSEVQFHCAEECKKRMFSRQLERIFNCLLLKN